MIRKGHEPSAHNIELLFLFVPVYMYTNVFAVIGIIACNQMITAWNGVLIMLPCTCIGHNNVLCSEEAMHVENQGSITV